MQGVCVNDSPYARGLRKGDSSGVGCDSLSVFGSCVGFDSAGVSGCGDN